MTLWTNSAKLLLGKNCGQQDMGYQSRSICDRDPRFTSNFWRSILRKLMGIDGYETTTADWNSRTTIATHTSIKLALIRGHFMAGKCRSHVCAGPEVPTGRYVVPTGNDNFIVSAGRPNMVPASRTIVSPGSIIFGLGEFVLSTLDVLQRFGFFLQMGFTLILATFDGLDVGLLGDVISEDDCDDDG
ncbi:hypothetical protein Tco_0963411 [Tanacetum coccineum]